MMLLVYQAINLILLILNQESKVPLSVKYVNSKEDIKMEHITVNNAKITNIYIKNVLIKICSLRNGLLYMREI